MPAPQHAQFADRIQHMVREYYETEDFIPLHAPTFQERERELVADAIESTFVSTVGEYVNRIEQQLCDITGARFAVATVNGTAALQVALRLAGVKTDSLVLTQPLTFVATGNAIRYLGADPVFLDVDPDTLGLSAGAVAAFLENETEQRDGQCVHRDTGRTIAACVPMHTFGFSVEITKLVSLCKQHNVPLVEDAAEALGSTSGGQALGTFGQTGVLSFNGNKIVTAGGGGAILTNDERLATRAKHLTTTAKVPHRWEYVHDETGYNFRMPNLNAALLSAQLERLPTMLAEKRRLALKYKELCDDCDSTFIVEQDNTQANYWLMTLLLPNESDRDAFLEKTNDAGVMTRPAWRLLNELPMFSACICDQLSTASDIVGRLVNVPSSPRV